MKLRLLIIFLLLSLISQGQVIRANPFYRPTAAACSYLLDQYSGAAAAYSLRKLDCDYAGSAVRIRRSSDNQELDVGFTASGDLDTAALKTFVGTGGTDDGFVVTWYDQSGNSRNMTQSASTAQPLLVDNGVIKRHNNIPCISFDGSNDYLGSTYSNNTNFTVIAASIKTSSDDNIVSQNNYFDIGSVASSNWGFISLTRRAAVVTTGPVTEYSTSSLSALPNNTSYLSYSSWDNTNKVVIFYRNNTAATNSSTSGTTLRTGALPNTAIPGMGYEVLIYPNDQSANRTAIQSNINTYYSIY